IFDRCRIPQAPCKMQRSDGLCTASAGKSCRHERASPRRSTSVEEIGPRRPQSVGFLSGWASIRELEPRGVGPTRLTLFTPGAYLPLVMLERSAAEHLRIRGAGPTLSYEILGPATDPPPAREVTLLCLHGNSSHRGVWRPVARELCEFRCVLLDLRGHGESEHVSPPAYDPEHHAADLARVVASLVQGPYVILGHSAGALAAARFITNSSLPDPVAMPIAFAWVDLDPLVPRWQVDYFHQGVASVA